MNLSQLKGRQRFDRTCLTRVARRSARRGMLAALWLLTGATAFGALDPARIVVVANQNDPDSMEIARHYVTKRGIPEKNLIQLQCPTTPAVSWPIFTSEIFNPLKERLIEEGWINGRLEPGVDTAGRREALIFGHRIDFLVTCRLPYRVNSEVRAEATQTETAAVDSELAMILTHGQPLAGPLRNPLFRKMAPSSIELAQVVRVSRLDGPTVGAAKELVDRAMEAEKLGLIGRAYLDLSGHAPQGDAWIEAAGAALDQLGFPTFIHRPKELLPPEERLDGAAFYFGWYVSQPYPAFQRVAKLRPGAIAMHIHSFSARDLRSTRSWTGFLVERGVAATVGNVAEPFLGATHQPDIIMEGLTRGLTAGESLWAALPTLSWMAIQLGDPLYQPNLAASPGQVKALEEGILDAAEAAYVLERSLNLRARAGEAPPSLVAVAAHWYRRYPSPMLAVTLGERLRAISQARLQPFAAPLLKEPTFAPQEVDAAWRFIQLLAAEGAPETVAALLTKLFISTPIDSTKEEAILAEAVRLAVSTGEETLTRILQARLQARSAPKP